MAEGEVVLMHKFKTRNPPGYLRESMQVLSSDEIRVTISAPTLPPFIKTFKKEEINKERLESEVSLIGGIKKIRWAPTEKVNLQSH